jgi:hypothetical protein
MYVCLTHVSFPLSSDMQQPDTPPIPIGRVSENVAIKVDDFNLDTF